MTPKKQTPSQQAIDMANQGIYSEIPEINQRIIDILPGLEAKGLILEDARPLPYGSRITLRGESTTIGINIYYSRKKGHSTVFDKKVSEAVQRWIRPILEPGPASDRISPFKEELQFASWIGCDEGGKGAFPGPLVAVAFHVDRSMTDHLIQLGVADSKTLSGKHLVKLATELEKHYSSRIGITILYPETYNRLYDQFKSQGRSLNHLLAWAHGKAVEKLMSQKPEAIVVDQFAYPAVIRPRMPVGPQLIIRTKAENNIGVAAASVIAGARYLMGLDTLSRTVGVKLMPGAGKAADQAVVEAVKKHGESILRKIVKCHFRNTEKVMKKI